jgi:chromosomal replication initiation ATPase DnaA
MKQDNQIASYSKSDLEFIHLLGRRGVSFMEALKMLRIEKRLRKSKRQFKRITDAVCEHFEITFDEMIEPNKRGTVSYAKGLACFLCCTMTARTLADIGLYFGVGYDTVNHHKDKIQGEIEIGVLGTQNDIKVLTNKIKKG